MSTKTMLKITNLNKEYKMFKSNKTRLLEAVLPVYQNHTTFSALSNFNLELKEGDVLGVLGKNGAGKSTLLKLITGVAVPTSGEIEINGKVSSLLELGTAFNMELTGEENIYQHGQVMGLTKKEIEDKKQEIIDFADIGDHLFQPVKTYSSGMFARLAFACAINVNPDILIVDEVLSVGDMAFQLKCFKKFEQFKNDGKTILFVTHNVADVLKNCNKAIILDKGKKIFDGEVKPGVELYKKLITGMLDEEYEDKKFEKKETPKNIIKEDAEWKKHFTLNKDATIYGNNQAKIYDYGIFNEDGEAEQTVNNDEDVLIKAKVAFNEDIDNPIISITIKDFHGKEICGTNTSFLGIDTGKCLKGENYIFEFKQKLELAPGKYTLSIGCTRYDENGNHIIMNRNYDILIFEIISNRPVVGYLKLEPEVNIATLS